MALQWCLEGRKLGRACRTAAEVRCHCVCNSARDESGVVNHAASITVALS